MLKALIFVELKLHIALIALKFVCKYTTMFIKHQINSGH